MATTYHLKESAPKFFKIIFDPRADRLRIPVEFVRRHGLDMPNPVFLKVPTASPMVVELIREPDAETWLGKGWPEFRDCYSIGFGHVLVFEYITGSSLFNVLIFDMSAMEIQYHNHNNEAAILAESDSDDSVVFLKEIKSSSKKLRKVRYHQKNLLGAEKNESTEISLDNPLIMKEKNRAQVGDLHPDDTTDHQFISDDCRLSRRPVSMPSAFSSRSKGDLRSKSHSKQVPPTRRATFGLKGRRSEPEFKKECNNGSTNGRKCSDKEVQVQGVGIDDEKSEAYEKATDFISNNLSQNPFLVALLRPSYVTKLFILNLSSKFVKANLPVCQSSYLTLRSSDGRTWSVRCSLGRSCASARITTGWKAFVLDNDLKTGDVCAFEAVNGSSKPLWNVFMFRNWIDEAC